MFTGIIQSCGTVASIRKEKDMFHIGLKLRRVSKKNIQKGASIAISGVCLTVVHCKDDVVYFDVMKETLDKTTLKFLKIHDKINVERSAKIGDEIGGHILSGHIFEKALIENKKSFGKNTVITFHASKNAIKHIVEKGFVALDGVSLTVVDVKKDSFTVHFIPATLKNTTFGIKSNGDYVNIEIDYQTQLVVKTIERFLKKKV